MADDKNLKNIEKSLEEIQKDTHQTASHVRNVRENVSELESSLKKVVSSTKDSVDGINRIASNTKNSGDIEKGVNRVVTKLEAIQKLTGDWAKNSDRNKGNGKGVVGNIEEKVKNILDRQNSIERSVSSMSRNVDDINYNTEKAADYLRLIKEHIVDGSTSRASSATAAAPSSTGGTGDIHSTVKSILTSVDEIKEIIKGKTLQTGNKEIDAKRAKSEAIKADIEYEEQIRRKYKNKGWESVSDAVKEKYNFKSEKEYVNYLREQRKQEQKREERISGKRGNVRGAIHTFGSGFVNDIISTEKPSIKKVGDTAVNAIGQLNPIVGMFAGLAKTLVELGSKQDRATSEFVRAIGGSRQGKTNAGDTVRGMVRTMPLNRGYTADAAYSAMTEVAEARGRTTERMTAGALQSAIDLKRFGIGAESINNFDTFGKSIEQTDRYFAKLYGEVSKKGLSFKNVSKAVNDNLKMAQSHTFANGLRGLQQMAEKSTQLKYNMQQVFQFADKVSELEGAISTSANLSVLGGQFAQFSNPMQLMYEGLNDTEALNDRILNMFGNKAYWNQEKGQMDMSALDREMLKQAAKAAGLDANEMLNVSYNQGKMRRIEKQIGGGVNKDTAEYIKNVAELDENGNAYVNIGGKERAVSSLTNEDKDALEKESRNKDAKEGAKLGDIYGETMSIGKKLDNMLSYLQEQLGRWVFWIFNSIAKRGNKLNSKAQGEDGDDELKKRRLNFYTQNLNNRHDYVPGNRMRFAEYVAGLTNEKLDELEKMRAKQGNSPNGLPIASNIPGNKGFANGPSHWDGGITAKYRGQPWEIEGNEFLLNKQSSNKYRDMLPKLQNGTFNPYSYANDLIKNNMNRHYMPMQVSALDREMIKQAYKSMNGNQPNSVSGTIKVDIPQTITLNLAGAGKIGDYDVSGLVKQLVDSMMKEWLMRQNFSGFDKENFPMKIVT